MKQVWSRLAVVLCALALSCAGPRQPAKVSAPAPASTDADAAQEAPSTPPLVIVDPGKEPRQLLRYVHRPRAQLALRMRQDMTMSINDGPAVRIPVVYHATIENVAVDTSGTAQRKGRFMQVELAPDAAPVVADAFTAVTKGFERVTFSDRIDPLGNVSDVSMDVSAVENEQLRSMLEGMQEALADCAMPFPEEPIGIGGKWRRTRQVRANGVTMEQVSLMTLVDRRGNEIDTAIEIAQHGENQELTLPDGSSAELVSLEGSGQGRTRTVLDPLSFEGQSTVVVKSLTRTQGADVSTAMTMELHLAASSSVK